MRGLETMLERVEPGSAKQQEYETEYANLSSEAQNYVERIDAIERAGREAYTQATTAFDRLNRLQSQRRPLSLEERYGIEQELLPTLADLGYDIQVHPASGRYLALHQDDSLSETLKVETRLNNFDSTVINYENPELRDWDEMEKLASGDLAILEDVASGELAGLSQQERFALLTRVARVSEALQNFQFTSQYGERLTKEQARLPLEEKQQLQDAKRAETQEFVAKRQRINRLVSTLERYGFQVTDRRADNEMVPGARRYQIDPDLTAFNEIIENGGLPAEAVQAEPASVETSAPAQSEAAEEGPDLPKPSLQEVSNILARSENIPDILNPQTLQDVQGALDSTVRPFVDNGRSDYLLYKPKRGFVPVTAERYVEESAPKLEVPRTGITNKDAAQIVANVLSQVPLGNTSTRESGTTHEEFRHRVFTDAQGKFRIERTPERLGSREAESLAPGVVPESAFSFVNLESEKEAPETVNPGEAFSFVNLPRASAEELEVINEVAREPEPESETDPSLDAETLAAAFDSAREGLREIGIPSTREEALEFQHHLDDTVAPYAQEDSEVTRRFLQLTDSYEDTVLELPTTNLTNREAAAVAATALNLLRPDQTPGSPEYYVLESADGSYSLEIKQTAPTGFAESEGMDEWDLPDEDEAYVNPFDLENNPALDAERDSAADDLDNPFALR